MAITKLKYHRFTPVFTAATGAYVVGARFGKQPIYVGANSETDPTIIVNAGPCTSEWMATATDHSAAYTRGADIASAVVQFVKDMTAFESVAVRSLNTASIQSKVLPEDIVLTDPVLLTSPFFNPQIGGDGSAVLNYPYTVDSTPVGVVVNGVVYTYQTGTLDVDVTAGEGIVINAIIPVAHLYASTAGAAENDDIAQFMLQHYFEVAPASHTTATQTDSSESVSTGPSAAGYIAAAAAGFLAGRGSGGARRG